MTHYVSYSLYGDKPLYLAGALENARQVPLFYPGWKALFYCGSSVPNSLKNELRELGAMVIEVAGEETNRSMYWRFQAVELDDAEFVVFRDTDSRLTMRERVAVENWLASNKALHVMRDHPGHAWWILGGMWGCRAASLKGIFIQNRVAELLDHYGEDQYFLYKNVYRKFRKNLHVTDSIFWKELNRTPFSTPRSSGSFVGEVIQADGQPDYEARRLLLRIESNRLLHLLVILSDWREMLLVTLQDLLRPKGRRKFS